MDYKKNKIIIGCMRFANMSYDEVEKFILESINQGIYMFDHADIYGGGKSEILFGEVLKKHPQLRQQIIIQTKCGIRKGFYDLSKEYIIESVEKSLKRLNIDYIDILLLHRPDALVEPASVNEAFNYLYDKGMVKTFGVSNHNTLQIALLNKYLDHKIEINQLQLSLTNSSMIDSGLNVNMLNELAINRDDSILDYCRLNDITIQAWSPVQYGFFDGTFINNEKYPKLNEILNNLASKYNVEPNAIAVAWISRHPSNIQTVIGTTKVERMKEFVKSQSIMLSKEEWYQLYCSVGKELP